MKPADENRAQRRPWCSRRSANGEHVNLTICGHWCSVASFTVGGPFKWSGREDRTSRECTCTTAEGMRAPSFREAPRARHRQTVRVPVRGGYRPWGPTCGDHGDSWPLTWPLLLPTHQACYGPWGHERGSPAGGIRRVLVGEGVGWGARGRGGYVCVWGGVAPYYRGRPVWVYRWVREAGPCASENDTRDVCTGALRVRHPHLGQSLWP